jgi:sulfane dehydrogenase subunit SoxC
MSNDNGFEFLRASDERKIRLSRRAVFSGGVAIVGWAASRAALAQEFSPKHKFPQPTRDDYLHDNTDMPWLQPGAGPSEVGRRSPFVKLKRQNITNSTTRIYATGSSPDWSSFIGTITPSDLCYERHHAGIPLIDPSKYRLLVHGMVDRPMMFTLEDLKRLPAEKHFFYWECQGNGGYRPKGGKVNPNVTILDTLGRSSACEWVGVPLREIMRRVNVHPEATWSLVESFDAAGLARSVDIDTLWNNAYLMYGQNGEPVRPENGYPVRLFVPGFEGNISNKWIRRMQFSNRMFEMREETSRYADHPNTGTYAGDTLQYSVQCGVRSHILTPSGGMDLAKNPPPVEVRGMAYSGYGKIARVEVSTDGGKTWQDARLHEPVLPRMATWFTAPWIWDGQETKLKSRAVDELGFKQPTHEWLAKYSPQGASYNAIQTWHIHPNGQVTHAFS